MESQGTTSYTQPCMFTCSTAPFCANNGDTQFQLRSPSAGDDGLLSHRSVSVKDTISVSGIPMTCGTQPFHLSSEEPYPVPDIDAPVVARVLEAGGVIKGTATCENYCVSLASFTSATGPVDNPWLKGHSAGGSSSGCAALVAVQVVRRWRERKGLPVDDLGEGVDLAVGTDQAGSIRTPAGYCGIYGLKPTHGLVPYTGIAGLHPMIDFAGPMAASIRDTALLLSVLAGYDGIDHRMTPETPLRRNVPKYHEVLDAAISSKSEAGEWTTSTAAKGLRVGVLKEAFEVFKVDAEVEQVIREAAARFARLGAIVDEVSIPLHAVGRAIWVTTNRGLMADTLLGNKPSELLSHPMSNLSAPKPDQKWFDTMTKSNPAVVNTLLFKGYFEELPHSVRAKSMMHVHQLRAAYDNALESYDVLLTPVTATVAPPHASADGSALERYYSAVGHGANTSPFNISGHPALSMPVGWATARDGKSKLPVAMQLVGKRWDESGVLLAAAAWEVGGHGLD
ncbi:Amidase [Purpureocillium takamizusanense]|uniref:Amidase n=1 Tax=Purpureocillium takamizusanense TaxID=2060973 RepID=A0A9Q8QTR9_9HYPO|nr:Amidase [Purpureocillium takamizusanense]UNI24691.1 Amidase [Purpureocillium takamizusanense]